MTQGDVGRDRAAGRLRDGEALGEVDPGMAAAEVGDEAGDRDVDGVGRPEELDAHDRAGERGVGRAREDRHESERGEQVRRAAEDAREGIAEARADEEQRRDLAALEARAQRDDREQNLPRPGPVEDVATEEADDRGIVRIGRGDAETEIGPGSHPVDEADHQQPAESGTQPRRRAELFGQRADPMGGLGEDQPGQPAGDPDERDLYGQHRIDVERRPARLRHAGEGDVVGDVADAPGVAGPVADDGGEDAGHQRRILHLAHGEHFECEDGAGDRRPEHRAEAGGDAGREQDADGWG